MRADERKILDEIRDELHAYHNQVTLAVAKLDDTLERLNIIELDVYGNPEDRDANPGLLAQVGDLRKSRKLARIGVSCAWTIATLVIGALIAFVMKGW